MLRHLLDTNIVIDVIKRRPPEVRQVFNRHGGSLAISAVTLAELRHGADKSANVARNHAVVDDFCSRLAVLSYGDKAAAHYGAIRAALEAQGRTIGVNDLHIAAHARSEGLTLVTNNVGAFQRVPGLLIEDWVDAPPG